MSDQDTEMKPAGQAASVEAIGDSAPPAADDATGQESPFLPGGQKLKREVAPDGAWVVEGKTFDQHMEQKSPEEVAALEETWGFTVEELRTAVKVVMRIRESPDVFVTPEFMASGMMWMINRSKSYKTEHRQLLKNIYNTKRKLQAEARKARDQSILQKTEMKVQRNAALQRLIDTATAEDPTVPAARLLSWKEGTAISEHVTARITDGEGGDGGQGAARKSAAADAGASNPLLAEDGLTVAEAESKGVVREKPDGPRRGGDVPMLGAPAAAAEGGASEQDDGKEKSNPNAALVAAAAAGAAAAAAPDTLLGASDTHSAIVKALAPNELLYERKCHICKAPYRLVHSFYDALCMPCGDFNYSKRVLECDLRGRVILVTGARIKIGFQIALKLLRSGATVFAATRFPYDAATRYAAEADYDDWSGRLKVFFLDLKNIPLVKAFCGYLEKVLAPKPDGTAAQAGEGVLMSMGGGESGDGDDAPKTRGRKVPLTDGDGRTGGRKRACAPPTDKSATARHGRSGGPRVEAGAAPFEEREGGGVGGGLYAIVNNAAQTVARPPVYYAALLETEAALRQSAAEAGAAPAVIDTEWDHFVLHTVRPAEAEGVHPEGRRGGAITSGTGDDLLLPSKVIDRADAAAAGCEKASEATAAAAAAAGEGATGGVSGSAAAAAAAGAGTGGRGARGVQIEDVTTDADAVCSGVKGRVEEDPEATPAKKGSRSATPSRGAAAPAAAPPGIVTLPQRLLSRKSEVVGLHAAAEATLGQKLDNDMYDTRLSALDARSSNSWSALLEEVTVEEAADVHTINALAPLVINSRLKKLLAYKSGPQEPRYIINVSAMEGQFYRFKQSTHPHTNMAKAALNMMTRTSSADYAGSYIYMSAVDTGWITDESPLPKAASRAQQGLSCPLDEIDAAARVVDLILTESKDHGRFWKDFVVVPW